MDHEYYMKMALDEAKKALKEGEFPAGCIMVCEDRIIATGVRKNSVQATRNELDHAEIVCLRRLNELAGSFERSKITIYSTMEPCLMCYSALILNGIRKIVYAYEDAMSGGTELDLQQLKPLYADMEITITPHVLRNESLALFKKFFSNPANNYWKESLLARYTLE
ncbi:MAG: nucleoside deaminase [Deltaproteobacteria bacterium]|jgi:tRNA(adenine34) deaminase|nr:nucleoside deaminase [Deltaproteobacteria bacterium]